RTSLYFILTLCSLYNPVSSETYRLSLHDALPIWRNDTLSVSSVSLHDVSDGVLADAEIASDPAVAPALGVQRHDLRCEPIRFGRSEEHTSELQSRENLVCRLLLE